MTAGGLAALLAFGIPDAPAPGEPLLLDAWTSADTVAAILARDPAPTLTWADSVPPGRDVTALLAAAARGGGAVTVAMPDDAGTLRLEPPARPVAGRRGALRLSVRAGADSEVPVALVGPGGRIDTVRVSTGPDGRGATAVAVEPAREGVATWTARSGDAAATVHAWVRPPSPVRVFVWGGAPGSESRYLVRALESAGMEVVVRQDLGRGLAVTTPGAEAPGSLDESSRYDVLVLVGRPRRADEALALRWVRERGGGLLLLDAVSSDSPLAPWAPLGAWAEHSAAEISWSGPAEIVPLPGPELLTRATPVPEGGVLMARVDGEPVVHRVHLGRGRIVAAGLESWPWVMKAGLVSEHRAFWESVVEWLAGGLTDGTMLVAEAASPGLRWEGRFEGQVPEQVLLTEPDSGGPGAQVLPVERSPAGTGRVAFVPRVAGRHTLRPAFQWSNADDTAAFCVVAVSAEEKHSWTDAALRVGRAGGRMGDAETLGLGRSDARSPGRPRVLPWTLFLALGGVSVAGWTLRRVRGLP
ncbi:MAG: hypothetical protein P8188_08625 [Gemmatimonadota bacterium]